MFRPEGCRLQPSPEAPSGGFTTKGKTIMLFELYWYGATAIGLGLFVYAFIAVVYLAIKARVL